MSQCKSEIKQEGKTYRCLGVEGHEGSHENGVWTWPPASPAEETCWETRAGKGTHASVLSEKLRQFAVECLNRYAMNREAATVILHTEDAYEDIVKLCDENASLQSQLAAEQAKRSDELATVAKKQLHRTACIPKKS